MKKQARFWVDHVGAVRIKLKPGQTVHCSHGGQTDEGYSWEASRYSFDGKQVICDWETDARDCDGRMTRGGTVICHVSKLSAGFDDAGIRFPDWQSLDQHQRDHSAEAMNY
jgi:hypothetical protein